MNTLIAIYPGDGFLIYCLEVFAVVALLIASTWLVERLAARRRAALRCLPGFGVRLQHRPGADGG